MSKLPEVGTTAHASLDPPASGVQLLAGGGTYLEMRGGSGGGVGLGQKEPFFPGQSHFSLSRVPEKLRGGLLRWEGQTH